MEWKFIDSASFDRTIPLTKCRFYMGNVPAGTPQYESTEGCFVELPNINMDLKSPSEYNTAEYGWPRNHKFNMVYMGGKYTNGSTSEISINTLPRVGENVYELEFPQPLYWGGVSDRTDPGTTPIYTVGTLIEVYGEFHTFEPDKMAIRFESTGGTDTITVDAETAWTATTTDEWLTLTKDGDTLTVEAPLFEGTERRRGNIYFEDEDGYSFTVSVTQKAPRGAGWSNLFMGEENTSTLYIGSQEIMTLYMGEQEVYSSGPFAGLKVSPKSLAFNSASTEKTLKVKSSEAWSLTCDADWLSFSQTSGDSGETTITVDCTATEDSATTIDFTAGSYTAEVEASYAAVDYLEYISNGDFSPAARSQQSINLNYYPTEATKAVITLNMQDGEGNICFGAYSAGSNAYWRMFSYSGQRNGMVFDIPTDGGYRLVVPYTWGSKATLEMGWAYIKNVDTGYIDEETSPSVAHNWIYPLQLWRIMNPQDLKGATGTKIYSIDIYEGNTKTMELRPALVDGEAGLWDNLSGNFYGNVGSGTITYGRF